MANDRLYLRCTVCGEETYFAKYYPSGLYIRIVDEWMHDHLLECGGADMFLGEIPFEWFKESDQE